MPKKDKISFLHSDDFESIDDELTAAMSRLEETNERIVSLLESDTTTIQEEDAPDGTGDDGHTEAGEEGPAQEPRERGEEA